MLTPPGEARYITAGLFIKCSDVAAQAGEFGKGTFVKRYP